MLDSNFIKSMLIKRLIFVFFFVFSGQLLVAQSLSLSQLFYPNVSLRADYMPSTNRGDGTQYGLSRNSILAIVPLRTEVQAGIGLGRKADIEAKHTLMIGNFTQIDPKINNVPQPEGGYKTASVSVVQLKASLRDRFWVYAAGAGISESNETFFKPQPFFYGGAARMRILGIKTQIFYGTAVAFNQKFRIIPFFGFTKALGDDWKISGILPFRASVSYKAQPWLHLDGNLVLDGYSAGYQVVSGSNKFVQKDNLQQIRMSISANAHLLTVFNIGAELGLMSFRQIRTFGPTINNYAETNPAPAPYFGLSVRYISSSSNLSSKFMKKVGLDL